MITIAICDDNDKDIKNIEKIIRNYMEMKLKNYKIKITKSTEELLASQEKFDLIFFEIVMAGMNGIEAGKKIRERNKNVKIIYTTSYLQYCEQAVNSVHAFAYLSKPITKEKAIQQFVEIMRYFQEENSNREIIKFKIIGITEEGKIENKFKTFEVNDIFYFVYLNRKVKIKLENEEYYFTDKMKNLADKMQIYNFQLCHQCFIVNLGRVKRIRGYEVVLENNEKIPVSQKKSSEFRKKLNKFIQNNI
ncbi:LytR/AlgR family response regulator transcription factor [Anaerosporobacter sp.]